eukprot:SAG11_NODE_4514_length_1867_cov_1.665724_2_plen_230_part_01
MPDALPEAIDRAVMPRSGQEIGDNRTQSAASRQSSSLHLDINKPITLKQGGRGNFLVVVDRRQLSNFHLQMCAKVLLDKCCPLRNYRQVKVKTVRKMPAATLARPKLDVRLASAEFCEGSTHTVAVSFARFLPLANKALAMGSARLGSVIVRYSPPCSSSALPRSRSSWAAAEGPTRAVSGSPYLCGGHQAAVAARPGWVSSPTPCSAQQRSAREADRAGGAHQAAVLSG